MKAREKHVSVRGKTAAQISTEPLSYTGAPQFFHVPWGLRRGYVEKHSFLEEDEVGPGDCAAVAIEIFWVPLQPRWFHL